MLKEIQIPPAFVAEQVIGRHVLQQIIDNDELLNGVAARWRTYPYGTSKALPADSGWMWIGWHIYRSDATTLHWDGSATAGGGDALVVTLTYGGETVYTNTIAAGDTEDISGTYDLTLVDPDFTDGYLYAVELTYSTSSRAGASITFACPYTVYTGGLSYTTPHAIVDTDTSAVTEWNAWRANDGYFQACYPAEPAQVVVSSNVPPAGQSTDIYWGWLPERFCRVYYKVRIDSSQGGTQLDLVYDPGGDNEQTESITTLNADVEDYFDLTLPGGLVEGQSTLLQATLSSPVGGANGSATIYYIRNAPTTSETLAEAFHSVSVAVLALLYADGGAAAGRLAYLNDNDDWLNAVYAIEGRQDYAVHESDAEYVFVRRGDELRYRVKDAKITFGATGSQSLTDYDAAPAPACGYQTLDLRTVSGLAYGMAYQIESDGASFDCMFAEEE